MTPIDQHYKNHSALLGEPLHEERACPDGVGRYRTYRNGSIHWHPDTGAWETHGAIRGVWAELGWENGFLGYPTSDESDFSNFDYIVGVLGDPYMEETPEPRILGRKSFFQGGCVVWWNDPEMPLQTGEGYLVLLRPKSFGSWRPVGEHSVGFLKTVLHSLVHPRFSEILANRIEMEKIPKNYGRSLWAKKD